VNILIGVALTLIAVGAAGMRVGSPDRDRELIGV
jgi:hypothetical protein